jgi:transposase
MKKIFIGIDISKEKLNLCFRTSSEIICEEEIANTVTAIKRQLGKDLKALSVDKNDVMVCAEYTGRYIYPLVVACEETGVFLWMEDPTRIKNSFGITRGKNDVVDARRIAEYAFRFNDKAIAYAMKDKDIATLKNLLADRDLLLNDRKKYEAQLKDQKKYMSGEDYKNKEKRWKKVIKSLKEQIASIEEEIRAVVDVNEKICYQVGLLKSIPGVGDKLAVNMVVITECFTRFENARQFNCYAGLAPFQYTSGKSVYSKSKVSQRANKHIKGLLHMASVCVSTHMLAGEYKEYYQRRITEGKHPMCILNAIRAKLVARMFSVIRRDTPYSEKYSYAG